MNRDKIVLAVLLTGCFTAIAFSKKITDHIMFDVKVSSAKYGTTDAWKADVKRVLDKTNDVTLSGKDRSEYRKMQYQFYDIVSKYNK